MRDVLLDLSLVHFLVIQDVRIYKELNKHGKAIITGIIDEKDEQEVLSTSDSDRFAKLSMKASDGSSKVIFTGLIESVNLKSEGNIKTATVTLTGGTRLLECVERTRTFQNKDMTYDALIAKVDEAYSSAKHLMHIGNGEAIRDMIVQYKENDWTFLKRLASHFNSCIIPDYEGMGIRYHFGLPAKGSKEMKSKSYRMLNEVDKLYERKENKVKGLSAKDGFCYVVKSREYFELGEGVTFRGQPLYISKIKSRYQGNELLHTYYLRTEGGCKQRQKYNIQLIGASLDANIIAVANDTVKVCVTVDGTQDKSTAKWFPYSTVYSSPDGTGWYCMPEEGDKVRLYFPNEKEEEGYIISSIHLQTNQSGGGGISGGQSAPRSIPDNKSISTKYNKQVELTPSTILITNNKGMTILMDDDKGITIVSDKDITIESEEELSLRSAKSTVEVEAPESIELVQGTAKITMKDEISVTGTKFKVQ